MAKANSVTGKIVETNALEVREVLDHMNAMWSDRYATFQWMDYEMGESPDGKRQSWQRSYHFLKSLTDFMGWTIEEIYGKDLKRSIGARIPELEAYEQENDLVSLLEQRLVESMPDVVREMDQERWSNLYRLYAHLRQTRVIYNGAKPDYSWEKLSEREWQRIEFLVKRQLDIK